MKSKVTNIIPEGATVTRADGSAVKVGDEIDDADAVTITIPAGASGGSVQFGSMSTRRAGVAERVGAGALCSMPLTSPASVTVPPVLAVGDAAPTTRLPRATAGTPPAVKTIS